MRSLDLFFSFCSKLAASLKGTLGVHKATVCPSCFRVILAAFCFELLVREFLCLYSLIIMKRYFGYTNKEAIPSDIFIHFMRKVLKGAVRASIIIFCTFENSSRFLK